jgi:hypothetical protein
MSGKGLNHYLWQGIPRSLQFSEEHSRHTRVLSHEVDVRHKDRLKRFRRCSGVLYRLIHPSQQAFRDPSHHGFQDRVFGGEVSKQRPLGQAHALGDGCGGDVTGILLSSQAYNRFNSGSTTLICRKMSGMFSHCLNY